LVVSIRQNGSLISSKGPWTMRLHTTAGDFYERTFPAQEIRASSGTWCQDRSGLADWVAVGSPSWGKVTGLEVNVPAYGGAGAGNVVSYADFVLRP
jgi:hypothetical protein